MMVNVRHCFLKAQTNIFTCSSPKANNTYNKSDTEKGGEISTSLQLKSWNLTMFGDFRNLNIVLIWEAIVDKSGIVSTVKTTKYKVKKKKNEYPKNDLLLLLFLTHYSLQLCLVKCKCSLFQRMAGAKKN